MLYKTDWTGIRSFGDLPGSVRRQINEFILDSRRARTAKLEAGAGKNMRDDPRPTLVRWLAPVPKSGFLNQNQELVPLWRNGRTEDVLLTKGSTTYKESWLTWDAFAPTAALLKEYGADLDAVYRIVTDRFPFVYGVATIVRRRSPTRKASWIFCGIRAAELHGVNTGMISFPAGLVNPGERIGPASIRELFEEWNEADVRTRPGYVLGLHDNAPSCTFTSLVETESEAIRDSFEWKGGKGVWVPEPVLLMALFDGNTEPLRKRFRENGVEAGEDIRIATDVREPAKELLGKIFPM